MKYINKIKVLLLLSGLLFIACSENGDVAQIIDLMEKNGAGAKLEISYPHNNTIYPPEIAAPTIMWEDKNNSKQWIVYFKLNNEIFAKSDILINPQWRPDSALWESIKAETIEKEASLTIIGFNKSDEEGKLPENIISSSSLSFKTSKDSVGAPIFYRTVTLPFGYAVDHLETISWRLGDISKYDNPSAVMEKLPVCGNCHSFSVDGTTIGMDVDYGNDKGSYFMNKISKQMKLEVDNIITWSDYKRDDKEGTFGLLSQVSPDGRYSLSTVKDRSIFVRIDELDYSQLFFPIKGIIGIYDSKTKQFSSLPGANDPQYCQSNPAWRADGKEIIFARAPYFRIAEVEESKQVIIPTELAQNFINGKQDYKYDLYRIPFNNGQGGTAVPIKGASNNGMSNFFAKYSPDGKWIVFTQAKNFMLLQPDAKLYIIPAEGGKPRLMNCNNPNTMNSWHSWSPNGKWIVFSSKARGPYTQLYLTHIDAKGNDSPPVLIENMAHKELACNIPEFVNIKQGGIEKIEEFFMDNDNYSFISGKTKLDKGDLDGALKDVNRALQSDPNNDVSFNMRALIKVEKGDYKGAIEDFTKVIELKPDKFDSYANRGALKFDMHDFKGAIKDFDKAISLNPKGSRAYYSRGTAKYNLGNYTGAIEDYTLCLKLNPKNSDALFERAIAKLQIDKLDSACEDLKLATELGNENARQYMLEYCQ
jgi:tetratricopeptide (TPR) repeat protein